MCFDTVHLNVADRYCSGTSLSSVHSVAADERQSAASSYAEGHAHHVPFGGCCSAGRACILLVCHKAHPALHDWGLSLTIDKVCYVYIQSQALDMNNRQCSTLGMTYSRFQQHDTYSTRSTYAQTPCVVMADALLNGPGHTSTNPSVLQAKLQPRSGCLQLRTCTHIFKPHMLPTNNLARKPTGGCGRTASALVSSQLCAAHPLVLLPVLPQTPRAAVAGSQAPTALAPSQGSLRAPAQIYTEGIVAARAPQRQGAAEQLPHVQQ